MENTINPIAAQVVENSQQSNTNGVPGSLPGETPSETQARMYKVMVDGQELDVDENELRRGYAHNRAASKRMEEAAMARKEAVEAIKLLKENPKAAMEQLGLSPRQFAEMIINEELSDAMLSPEQKELRSYKQKVEQFENERRQAQQTYEQQQMEAEINRQAESIQGEIINVLDSAGLPKTERTVGRIIYYMQSAIEAGYNVSPKDVIDQVKQDYRYDINSLLGGLPEEVLETFLGKDMISRIAKSTVKSERKMTTVPKEVNANRTVSKEKKIMSPRDFFKNL